MSTLSFPCKREVAVIYVIIRVHFPAIIVVLRYVFREVVVYRVECDALRRTPFDRRREVCSASARPQNQLVSALPEALYETDDRRFRLSDLRVTVNA